MDDIHSTTVSKPTTNNPLKKLYFWTLHWAGTKYSPWALFLIAFAESSFFPIPPDVLLIPMVVARPKKFLRIATICTLGSILGALLGYYIGWGLYEAVGKPIIQTYHLQEEVALVGAKYQANAFWAIFTAAFTPIPYKVFTISAGLFKISLETLIMASIIGRAGRFFFVAGALRIWGARIAHSIERNFNVFSIMFVILLIGGFLVITYVS